jgi:hypothetical protein
VFLSTPWLSCRVLTCGRYNADASAGAMRDVHQALQKGDRDHQWPVKQLAPACGGKLCCLAVRLAYEEINPVPAGVPPACVPYWQQVDGRLITRARLQSYLQMHMKRMGAPAHDHRIAPRRCAPGPVSL